MEVPFERNEWGELRKYSTCVCGIQYAGVYVDIQFGKKKLGCRKQSYMGDGRLNA